jgi:hypothetical protein
MDKKPRKKITTVREHPMHVPVDVVKALISSESDFNPDPLGNRKIAIGIAQITKKTLKILQDPNGEAKKISKIRISQYQWQSGGYIARKKLPQVNSRGCQATKR